MSFDIGGGRRQPGFRTGARTNKSAPARAQRAASRISTTRQIATSPTLTTAQRIASAPKRSTRENLSAALSRIDKILATPGGATGVSGGVKAFADSLAHKTHLSPHVTAAWATQEGGNGGSNFNLLNIGTGLDPATNAQFSSPKGAASLTAKFLRGKALGASPGIQGILPQAAGKSDQKQLDAIAGSGWAQDPAYRQHLAGTYARTGEKPTKTPSPKDVKTLEKAGIASPGRAAKAVKATASGPHPFKKAASRVGSISGDHMVSPKWDPNIEINQGINPIVKAWAKKYGVTVNAAFDPGGGHVSPGHNVTGTATDVQPVGGWTPQGTARFEQGLKVLTNAGFDVLYGTNGIGHVYPNHGRGNHAHIEWASVGAWSAGSSAALQKLGHLSNAQITQIESTKGSGGSSAAMSGTASAVSSFASATGQSKPAAAKALAKMTPRQRLAALKRAISRSTGAFGPSSDTSAPVGHLSRAHGSPVI